MNENRRYHILIEQQVDIFVEVCKNRLKELGLQDSVWVVKHEEESMVGIGDPDKLPHSKDFGFVFYYEQIISRPNDAIEEFKFKLDHFVKVAKSTGKFKVFKDGSTKT